MKLSYIFFVIFLTSGICGNLKAAKSSPGIEDLIGLYELIDKYKPESCDHKIVVPNGDGCSLICIKCENDLLDGKSHHIIGRFGQDLHVHVMHEECFEEIRDTAIPCPFCRQSTVRSHTPHKTTQSHFALMIEVLITMKSRGSKIQFTPRENMYIKLDLSCIHESE